MFAMRKEIFLTSILNKSNFQLLRIVHGILFVLELAIIRKRRVGGLWGACGCGRVLRAECIESCHGKEESIALCESQKLLS
jgi:hypothetical protein